MTWPIHEYDPRPDHRRLRRATAVLVEHLRREFIKVGEWELRHMMRFLAWVQHDR
jgi:hypothetical protein